MVHQLECTLRTDKDFIAEIIKADITVTLQNEAERGIHRRRQQFNVVTDTNEQKYLKRCKYAQTKVI